MSKFISKKQFYKISPGDTIKTRFMGKCDVISTVPNIDEILVKFTTGPWKDKELNLIRQQIEGVNKPYY
tara:strand:- start:11482 stop:11688 length:207 start_codon:yes stop_codon:yes gene_type:complete